MTPLQKEHKKGFLIFFLPWLSSSGADTDMLSEHPLQLLKWRDAGERGQRELSLGGIYGHKRTKTRA